MTKQDTLILKGIALLMMIVVHIDTNQSLPIINFGNTTLWEIIHGGCFPVAFFLLLSGYGLRYVYENGDNHHLGRIIKLFIHYWAILLVFVSIGFFKVGAGLYPGDWMKILENVSSFHTSYNYECWFLFPFTILSLTYPCTLKLFDRWGAYLLILSCLGYFLSGYLISHYHLVYKTAPHTLYNIVQVPFLFFSFLIGASMKKWNILDFFSSVVDRMKYAKYAPFVAIIIVLFLGVSIRTTALDPFISFLLFVSLFMLIKGHECKLLQLIGKHSMNIWMIHTFFIHYLFHDEMYSFKYTILVYLVALTLSLACSYVVNLITAKIDNKIYKYDL